MVLLAGLDVPAGGGGVDAGGGAVVPASLFFSGWLLAGFSVASDGVGGFILSE
ncbi:MAG: hypothetical protein ACT4OO_05005 [Nitrospiraceae bacterium]